MTRSPSRMSLRLMSSTVVQRRLGDGDATDLNRLSCARGLSAPVRPTRMWIWFSVVWAVIGAHLNARA